MGMKKILGFIAKHGFGTPAMISAVMCTILLSGCKGPARTPYNEQFLALEDVACIVGSRHMIDFSAGIVQTDCNPGLKRYRASVGVHEMDATTGYLVEVVKEYFVLTLESDPATGTAEGASPIPGKLLLRTNALNREYKATFAVLKLTDSRAWLWDENLKLGVVIPLN